MPVRSKPRLKEVAPLIVTDTGAYKYDWDSWFKLGNFVLQKGVDYNVRTGVMIQQTRNAARRHGVRVAIKNVTYDEMSFQVSVLGPDSPKEKK